MSIRQGSKFIAGNLALKVQDRLFTAQRSLEGTQEYYDIIVPVGATLGFVEGTRLMLIVSGTNTTTTPILRYGATQFYIVSSNIQSTTIGVGELKDGLLIDLFVRNLTGFKEGTDTPFIYLGRGGNDYSQLLNTPIFIGRLNNEKPLLAGENYYTTLGLPYIEGSTLVVNDLDVLAIDTDNLTFLSSNRLRWKKGPSETEELATLRDIQELAVADQFVAVLVYSRNSIAEMELIPDAVIGDTCLVLDNSTIYSFTNTGWVVQEVLDYNLTTDNGKYFDIEDVDGDNSGKVLWNIVDGGKFQTFIDYTNSIDGVTITRNPSSRAIQVAKLPNSLIIKNFNPDGSFKDQVEFDGSSTKTFDIKVDLSNYYTKVEVDNQYAGVTPGNISRFYTDVNGKVRLQDAGIASNHIVVKNSSNSFLQTANGSVNANMIRFNKTGYMGTSVADFLNLDIVVRDKITDFVAGQTIAGSLIATENWVTNTFLPNTFDVDVVGEVSLRLDSPSAGKTSLRFTKLNFSTSESFNQDVELPVVNGSNNGLVTPAQVNVWDTVVNKLDVQKTTGSSAAHFRYEPFGGYPQLEVANSFRSSFLNLDLAKVELLTKDSSNLYSGIITNDTGSYVLQKESYTIDNAHKIATEGYVEQNVVLQDDIVTDISSQWSGKKVALGAIIFNFTESSASYSQLGSNVATGGLETFNKPFPIVSSLSAGLMDSPSYVQLAANTAAIANLQGRGLVSATLPQPPTQSDIQNAWDTAKPTIPSVEGSSVLDLVTLHTWRLTDVGGTLTWVDLGILSGTEPATNTTLGIVQGSATGDGKIFVESNSTMSVIGWDELVNDVGNMDLSLSTLENNYDNHTADVTTGNSTPHVTAINRANWDTARTTANAAIPKVPAAINNNLVIWSTGGVIKDSLIKIVTNFTTPTDLTIPTTKAIDDAKQNKLTAGANITIVDNIISASSNAVPNIAWPGYPFVYAKVIDDVNGKIQLSSEPVGSSVAMRTPEGRIKASEGVADDDVITKSQIDSKLSKLYDAFLLTDHNGEPLEDQYGRYLLPE